jgi:dihydroceramide fatty acyl 2-hydroxylase
MATVIGESGKGRQPWLLAMTTAPWNYAASFVADTITALVPLAWWAFGVDRASGSLWVLGSAILTYTLMEYVMHRFMFHGVRAPEMVREGHRNHHRRPESRNALPFFVSAIETAALFVIAVAVLGQSRGALFTGICAFGYLAYSTVHHLLHTSAGLRFPLRWLHDVHEVHHRHPRRNFGVTSPLWDFILGTYTSPKRA